MVFDVRIGLYNDPPKEEPLGFIEAVHDIFHYTQKLELGFDKFLLKFVDTTSFKKVQEAIDIILDIGQKYVDDKMEQLSEQGDTFHENQGNGVEPRLKRRYYRGEGGVVCCHKDNQEKFKVAP